MKIPLIPSHAVSALLGLILFSAQASYAEIISNGNLNTSVGQYSNTVGTIVYSLDTATGNVLRSGPPDPTGVQANEWLWTAITRGFNYSSNGGSGGTGDGAFVTNTSESFTQNVRGVLQFADDDKATTGSQTVKMDMFLDDNTPLANALSFRVELYAWNGSTSPGLSLGGPTANSSNYNTTNLNGATTILDTTVAATSVADAAWQTVTLGTVDLGSGYDFYVWRIGVFGQTDTDVFKFDNVTVTPVPFKITSFTSIDKDLGIWQAALVGSANTPYVFRSSTNLDFSTGTIVENLTAGVPAAGSIGGTNNRVVTTDGSGNATVRMTLTGNPYDFVRAESAP